MKDNNEILVMPVVRKKPWVNADKYNKNKIMGANTTLQPYLGKGGFQTGLEGDPELQKELEDSLGLVEGALKPVLSNDYWHNEVNIKLEDGPNTFNKNLPKDRLAIMILKNHPKVANSEAEITPDSDFYIVDVIQEQAKKATTAEKKAEAYAIFTGFSIQEKRQFLKLYGKGGADMSENDVFAELGAELENNVDEFLLKAKYSKEKINMRAFIFDLVQYNILRLRGGSYFDSDEDKGNIEVLTNYLLAPDKQDIYFNYKERLEHAKRGN